jgi:hypothetical protein
MQHGGINNAIRSHIKRLGRNYVNNIVNRFRPHHKGSQEGSFSVNILWGNAYVHCRSPIVHSGEKSIEYARPTILKTQKFAVANFLCTVPSHLPRLLK